MRHAGDVPTIAAGLVVPYDVVTGGHTIPRRVAALGAAAAATAAVGRERIGFGVTTGSGVVTLALRPGPVHGRLSRFGRFPFR